MKKILDITQILHFDLRSYAVLIIVIRTRYILLQDVGLMARVLFVNVKDVLFARLFTLLKSNGHQVIDETAQQTFDRVQNVKFDIAIGFLNSIEALARFHVRYPQAPIIILSDRPSIQEAVEVMKAGAADYLANHLVDTADLIERIEILLAARANWSRQLVRLQEAATILQSIVNEVESHPEQHINAARFPLSSDRYPIQVKDLVIDPERRSVTYRDKLLKLSPTEFDILLELAQTPNHVLTFEEIILRLRNVSVERNQARSMLTAHMSNLRVKLRDMGCDYLANKRGKGYYLNVPDNTQPIWGFAQLQWLVEHTLDIVVFLQNNQQVEYVSPSLYYLLGHDPATLISRPIQEWLAFVHPDDLKLVNSWLDDLPQQSKVPIIYRIRHQKQHYLWVQVHAKILYGQDGTMYNVVLVLRDITTLQDSQRFLETITDHVQVLIARFNHDHRCVYVNRFAQTFTIGEGIIEAGKILNEMTLMKEIQQDWQQALQAVFKSGEMQEHQFSINGQVIQSRFIPEASSTDSIQYVMAIISHAPPVD